MARGGIVLMAATGAGLVGVGIAGVVFAMRVLGAPPPAPPPVALGPAGNAAVADDGMRAPGAAELRALGCAPALVVDMTRLLGGKPVRPGEPRFMITCDVPVGADPPTCDRAAAVYFSATGGTASDPVGVRVLRTGAATPACSRLYAPNGADLGVFPRPP